MCMCARAGTYVNTVAGVGAVHVGARLIPESNRGSLREVQVLAVPEHGVGRALSTSCQMYVQKIRSFMYQMKYRCNVTGGQHLILF